jgi:hypothetical protein
MNLNKMCSMYNKKLFLIYLYKVAQYTDSTKHHCHKEALIIYFAIHGLEDCFFIRLETGCSDVGYLKGTVRPFE